MFALLLAGALLGQSLAAPSSCGTICDHTTGHQVMPSNQGGYSNYRKWGSSSSWSSGSLDSGYGSTSSGPARLEDLDEGNVVVGHSAGGVERPGSWRDEKSYVTNDGKGKIDYRASQTVTGNSFKKYAESSYSYGSNAHHEPQPNSQIIHSSQFEYQIQDVQREMQSFIGRFSLGVGSIVNQNTLDTFNQQAQSLTNQITSLCDRADSSSEEYRRLQNIKQAFDRQVKQKQQEIMNIVYESASSVSVNVGGGGVGGANSANLQQKQQTYQPQQYRPTTSSYRPTPSVNLQALESERLQQECHKLRGNIDNFYKNFVAADLSGYNHEDSLSAFRGQVNSEVAKINQQIVNLRAASASFEYQSGLVEDMHKTFERYVQNLNDHLRDTENRIRQEQLRLIEEQDRLEKERLAREKAEVQRRYDESLRIAEEERRAKEIEIQERAEQQRREEERQRLMIQQRPQTEIPLPKLQPLPQQVQAPVDTTSNVDVHYTGSSRHQVSVSGTSGRAVAGQHQHQQQQVYQPLQIGPHVDIVEINNKMNQEYNRLLSSVSGLSGYSMQLTEGNHESLNAEFQREFDSLRRKIESLSQQSSQYHNDRVLQAAEDLKRSLEQSLQYFQQECDKVSNGSSSSSSSSSWHSGGRYTNVRQPHISNVEISHSKSTEIEVSHGGRAAVNGGAGQRQVLCVEQYADQPCYEPLVRTRREAGGYYSQQRDYSNLDEYKPRRNTYQRRRTYEPEDEDYSQQHVDPQLELDDYAERTGQEELPRNRQPFRSENYRRRGGLQNHDEHSTQQANHYSPRGHQQYERPYGSRYRQQDSSQQYVQSGQNEDLNSYQKPRSQRIEASSQQHVQTGQNEDLLSYQKPRGQRIEGSSQQNVQSEDLQKARNQRIEITSDEKNSQVDDRQRGTQQVHAANLQREQFSASTGRTLLDQGLVVDEPREFVKPIVKPGKAGSARGVDDHTLETSGFYDNPKLRENSKLDGNVQQQNYERPQQTIETHGKSSEEIQKPRYGDLTLENSGFDDYQQQSQRGQQRAVTQRPSEDVTIFKDLIDSQESEDLTLQHSGFFEKPDGQLEQPRRSVSNQGNDSTQQSSFDGPEFQPGRQSSSHSRPESLNSHHDDRQRTGSAQNYREYEPRNEHPVGQYMHNLPQQNVPSSGNIIDLEDIRASGQIVNGQSDKILLPSENQESSVTAYPPVRPAPKPIPRYTRPGQYSPNVQQKPENKYVQQSANQNTNVESDSSYNSNESNKPYVSRRGDLPGISEPTTEEPIYIPPYSTPAPNVRPATRVPITETSQEIVPEVPTERTPCFASGCQQNQFDQLSQSYYYRQQNQQNIRFTHQSTYDSQQNLGINSGYQNPFYQHNSQDQTNQQVSPINHVRDGGHTFSYRGEQTNRLRINHQGSAEREPLEQSDLLGSNREESSQQQIQQPSFDNLSGQREFSQHHSTFSFNQQSSQTTDDDFPASVVPLDETQSRNLWADIESTTRPTFWKRVGHKLSNTYEKVKEGARTVYG